MNLRKRLRVTANIFVRAYGNYVTKQGKNKRFSFQVKIREGKNRNVLYSSIKHMCGKLKHNEIPLHKKGEVFDDFGDLLIATPWIKVRKIRQYKAGVVYER